MTATDTVRASAHANCDHPKTKAARAACRRARARAWVEVTRDTVRKGELVRVHTDGEIYEGVILGWGEKRLVIRVGEGDESERVTIASNMLDMVEAPGA